MSARRRASRDFLRAVFKEASTIEASNPIMAITTKSSMRVKPAPRFHPRILCWIKLERDNNRNLSWVIGSYVFRDSRVSLYYSYSSCLRRLFTHKAPQLRKALWIVIKTRILLFYGVTSKQLSAAPAAAPHVAAS